MVTDSTSHCKNKKMIIVVSGLPRSGTSLVMNMLHKGGVDIVKDENRQADIDNPEGYFELENVKNLNIDSTWIPECRGMAIKIVSPLLRYLPLAENYKIIFVHRKLSEIMESQKKMLNRIAQKKETENNDESLKTAFKNHLKDVEKWISKQQNDVLHLWYHDIIMDTSKNAELIGKFVEKKLDYKKMSGVVRKDLYRCKG